MEMDVQIISEPSEVKRRLSLLPTTNDYLRFVDNAKLGLGFVAASSMYDTVEVDELEQYCSNLGYNCIRASELDLYIISNSEMISLQNLYADVKEYLKRKDIAYYKERLGDVDPGLLKIITQRIISYRLGSIRGAERLANFQGNSLSEQDISGDVIVVVASFDTIDFWMSNLPKYGIKVGRLALDEIVMVHPQISSLFDLIRLGQLLVV